MSSKDESFDYIVVGAGSAGCVVANRLVSAGHSVCLIEAGPADSSPLIHIPFGIIGLIREGRHNWGYNTEPEPQLNNRRLYWPRGKTLGGSSSINAMVYIRGNPADYNEWADAGNEGWGWKDILPVFTSLEHNERGADAWHGDSGELNVTDVRDVNPLSKRFIEAGRECGHYVNPDFNGARQDGVGFYQVTQKNGLRFSSAKAFLKPIKSAPKLTILTNTHVTRVITHEKRATGVEVRNRESVRQLNARREIILCGGAINSPQLLLLSGIGPRAELQRHGIPLVHDLPGVGQNLQDHLDITLMIRETSGQAISLSPSALPRMIVDMFRYLFKRRGVLASNASETGGFLCLPGEAPDRPGVQLHFIPSFLRDHGRELTPGYGCTIHACQLRPKSRGQISLHSADPLAAPRIEPNYLSHPDDLRAMLDAFGIARRMFASKIFSDVSGGEDAPGPHVQSEEDIIADIRARAETIYHPAGTCRMGIDGMSVVDSRLRVHGIAGLRVADASIMPTLIGGNTNAPCMVIGEKCATMIMKG